MKETSVYRKLKLDDSSYCHQEGDFYLFTGEGCGGKSLFTQFPHLETWMKEGQRLYELEDTCKNKTNLKTPSLQQICCKYIEPLYLHLLPSSLQDFVMLYYKSQHVNTHAESLQEDILDFFWEMQHIDMDRYVHLTRKF